MNRGNGGDGGSSNGSNEDGDKRGGGNPDSVPRPAFVTETISPSDYFDYDRFEAEEALKETEEDPSVLLSLVQSYDWPGTLRRIASHPDEAVSVGMQGRTPLHVACDHDAPAVVIQALLAAYPEASCMVGTSDMTPLHITCSSQHASVHVVKVLLEGSSSSGKETSMRDVDGDTPLHNACRCGAPIEVLELLLRANPSVVHERDYEGLTPLLRLWVRYFVTLGDDVINSVKHPQDLSGELLEAWEKTKLLLRAAHHGSLDTSTTAVTYGGVGAATTGIGSGLGPIPPIVGPNLYNPLLHHECLPPVLGGGLPLPPNEFGGMPPTHPMDISGCGAEMNGMGTCDEKVALMMHGGGGDLYSSGTVHAQFLLQSLLMPTPPPIFRAVHAAAAVDCPRPVVKIAAAVHPDQVNEPDEYGRLPLMIAATAPTFKVHDLTGEGYCIEDRIHGDYEEQEAEEGHQHQHPSEQVEGSTSTEVSPHEGSERSDVPPVTPVGSNNTKHQPSVIEILLEASTDPARIRCPLDGRLPLHLAISSGKHWFEGVKAIMDAYPDAIMLPDRPTGLYPFMLAAVGDNADPTTIFELLVANPALVTREDDSDEESSGGSERDGMYDTMASITMESMCSSASSNSFGSSSSSCSSSSSSSSFSKRGEVLAENAGISSGEAKPIRKREAFQDKNKISSSCCGCGCSSQDNRAKGQEESATMVVHQERKISRERISKR